MMQPDDLTQLSDGDLYALRDAAETHARRMKTIAVIAVIGACVLGFTLGWGLLSADFCAGFPIGNFLGRLFCASYLAGSAAIGGNTILPRVNRVIDRPLSKLDAEIGSRNRPPGAGQEQAGSSLYAGIQKDFTSSVGTADVITVCRPLRFKARVRSFAQTD